MMGRVAGERARLVVVTDEDPRGEDRQRILEEIAAGAEDTGKRRGLDLLLIADRRAAIRTALERRAAAMSSSCAARATSKRSRWPTARSRGTTRRWRAEELALMGYGEAGAEAEAEAAGVADGRGVGEGVAKG